MNPSMSDDELRPVIDEIRKFEGLVLHLYLDDDDEPNVTIGIGCLVSSRWSASELPFRHKNGTPATMAEVEAEFLRVQSCPHHRPASFYAGDLFIAEQDAYNLAFAFLRPALVDLDGTFPGWPAFPTPAKQALLDLRWNAGSLRSGWPHLLAACNALPPDWLTASRECSTANPKNKPDRAARNEWRVQCVRSAAAVGV
jgi:hypothetical protein